MPRFIILLIAALVIFSGVSFWKDSQFLHFWGEGDDGKETLPPAVDVVEEKFRTEKYAVAKGDTWESIAKDFLLDWNIGLSLLEASNDVHSLAAIREGNEFRFLFDKITNELVGVEYDIDDESILALHKNGDEEFEAQEEEIRYEIKHVTKRGVIKQSLFETAHKEGIPSGVILNLAHIFAWDVDFASSVQPEDSFAVLYEERFREGERVKPGKILAARFTNAGRDVYAFFYEDPEGSEGYYNEEGRELRRQFLRSPLDYKRITSGLQKP